MLPHKHKGRIQTPNNPVKYWVHMGGPACRFSTLRRRWDPHSNSWLAQLSLIAEFLNLLRDTATVIEEPGLHPWAPHSCHTILFAQTL